MFIGYTSQKLLNSDFQIVNEQCRKTLLCGCFMYFIPIYLFLIALLGSQNAFKNTVGNTIEV